MSELQIKILKGGAEIFLQGDGDLVYKIFSEIREKGFGELGLSELQDGVAKANESEPIENQIESTLTTTAGAVKPRKKAVQSSGQLIKNLDLSGRNGAKPNLKDFIAEKNPVSNVQKTASFVWYLQHVLELDEITIDHIFTCYKTLGYRMPTNLQQNLADTCSSRYGYISRKDGKYSMTVVGDNYIEFDMNKGE